MLKFTDFVNIIDTCTTILPDDMISVCKRENNSKRDFLFVNRFQGKHVPAKINDILHLYSELRAATQKRVDYDRNEKLCVIGFAETATAIGNYLAEELPNCHYYLQTTRELSKEPLIVEFKEEHSHATQQKLHGDIERLKECDRILFVDDEVSTGNTIKNFIKELEKIKHFKYSISSFLNLMPVNTYKDFEQQGVHMYYLIRGVINDMKAKVLVEQNPDIRDTNDLKENGKLDCVLNIGLEEDMWGAIKNVASQNTNLDKEYFQASTRSPIVPANDLGYALNSRVRFYSLRDDFRKVFLYNLRPYKAIYVYAREPETRLKKELDKYDMWKSKVLDILLPLTETEIYFVDYID